MKNLVIIALIATVLVVVAGTQSYASDWDKAGKVLAVLEGMRVLTGGKADVIGTVTGINRPREQAREQTREYEHNRYGYEHRRHFDEGELVWVPHYVWKEKYVPEHIEWRDGHKVIIEAHYEKYQVQEGGHWEKVYTCARR